ncbi:MAG: hypothetical protein GTO51_08995 [Candidatus Latescibacteria bacterium]|nr:hypothetical protein [Candidatus Latescibacterota bacterium]NIM22088.1 hypothetical protein [Candidatus Latescibacterota bacterium]NIM66107.1 hypothetical protein [Candidatus Latescibacterota bacterium]NIO02515.1 hypothetical protein [Candidatus Latescibacterota bacterium]NIO29426.1 hypothetical protein [Candidatus Latescibacterota bacterium]
MVAVKFLKRKIAIFLIDALILLARILPRRLGMKVFSALGRAASHVFQTDRRKAMENLSIAFPETAPMLRAAITRAMYITLGENIYEFFNLEGSSRGRIKGLVDTIEGEPFLRDAFNEGKGVIAITGHIGCWELLGAHLVSRGYPVTVVARSLQERKWQKRIQAIRSSVGVASIDRDSSAREMLKPLRRGEILGVLMDQKTRVSGLFVPFFNKPAHTPSGVAKLSAISGAKIVPMAIYMDSNSKHLIRILEPISPPPRRGDREKGIRNVTSACSQAIEKLIRYDPKQWIWWHDRWSATERAELDYAVQN